MNLAERLGIAPDDRVLIREAYRSGALKN